MISVIVPSARSGSSGPRPPISPISSSTSRARSWLLTAYPFARMTRSTRAMTLARSSSDTAVSNSRPDARLTSSWRRARMSRRNVSRAAVCARCVADGRSSSALASAAGAAGGVPAGGTPDGAAPACPVAAPAVAAPAPACPVAAPAVAAPAPVPAPAAGASAEGASTPDAACPTGGSAAGAPAAGASAAGASAAWAAACSLAACWARSTRLSSDKTCTSPGMRRDSTVLDAPAVTGARHPPARAAAGREHTATPSERWRAGSAGVETTGTWSSRCGPPVRPRLRSRPAAAAAPRCGASLRRPARACPSTSRAGALRRRRA